MLQSTSRSLLNRIINDPQSMARVLDHKPMERAALARAYTGWLHQHPDCKDINIVSGPLATHLGYNIIEEDEEP